MTNHLRCLLLNQSAWVAPAPTFPGEEYVPPDFHAVSLPSEVAVVHRQIFGDQPDRAYLNWRLRELLGLLHGCELRQFVFALDRRVTYLPFGSSLFQLYAAGPVSVPVAPATQPLTFIGASGLRAAAQLFYDWGVSVLDSSSVLVTQTSPAASQTTFSYSLTDGVSNILPLPGSSLRFRFQGPVGSAWNVSALAAPQRDLSGVADDVRSVLTPAVRAILFGVDPSEPFRTFQALWDQHEQFPYRLGGLVLALAYRINQLRGG